MKTYISLSGFDSSQIVSLIVKYGIEGKDRIILIRPEVELDTRGELTVQAIRDLSRQIDSSIDLQIHRVNHRDFEGMVISLKALLEKAEGQIIANLSGGPREIFLAFTIACLSQSEKIFKTTNYSDIERSLQEITLPNITATLERAAKENFKGRIRESAYYYWLYRKTPLRLREHSLPPGGPAGEAWRSACTCPGQDQRGAHNPDREDTPLNLGEKAFIPLTAKIADNSHGGPRMVTESEFAGKWKVIEAVDMVEDDLSLSPDSYLLIQVNEKNEATGSYQFGTQDGYIDGRFEGDNESLMLIFSFEGWDEADLVNGSGTFGVESGDTFLFTMIHENGNTFSFRCRKTLEDPTTTANDAA